MRKRRVVGRIYGRKYSWMGQWERNRHKKRMKKNGQAVLVYVKNMNRNIPTTWNWVRGDCQKHEQQHPHHVKLSPWGLFKTCTTQGQDFVDRRDERGVERESTRRSTLKDETGSLSVRPTLKDRLLKTWEDFWETGRSKHGLSREGRYHLELNWNVKDKRTGYVIRQRNLSK